MQSILLALCCCVTLNLGAHGGDFDVLLGQACAKRTTEYRAAVDALLRLPHASEELEKATTNPLTSDETRLQARILVARLINAPVFAAFASYVAAVRKNSDGPRQIGTRAGQLEGLISQFVMSGGKAVAPPIIPQASVSGQQPTNASSLEAEAARGAALLALVEHIIKFLSEGREYEQVEMLAALQTLCTRRLATATPMPEVNLQLILLGIANDKGRLLLVRYRAAMYLPAEKRPPSHDLMMEILRSNQTNDFHLHARMVKDAAAHVKNAGLAQDIRELRMLKAEAYWKQCIINEVAGVPPPPAPKSAGVPVGPFSDEHDGLRVE